VHNGWLADCRPDEWCDVSVEGLSTPEMGIIILIFDTMGGPRTVKVRQLKCEVPHQESNRSPRGEPAIFGSFVVNRRVFCLIADYDGVPDGRCPTMTPAST